MTHSHYNYFHTALKTERKRQRKQQKELAIDAGVSESYISELIQKKKKASQGLQEKLAFLLGYSLLDFLILGRSLVEGKNFYLNETPTKYVVTPAPKLLPETTQPERRQHQTNSREGLLGLFADKERARSIILDLLEIEKRDATKLDRIGGYIQGILEGMPAKKNAARA